MLNNSVAASTFLKALVRSRFAVAAEGQSVARSAVSESPEWRKLHTQNVHEIANDFDHPARRLRLRQSESMAVDQNEERASASDSVALCIQWMMKEKL